MDSYNRARDKERRKRPGFLRFRAENEDGDVVYRPIWQWLRVSYGTRCTVTYQNGESRDFKSFYIALILFSVDVYRDGFQLGILPKFHAYPGLDIWRWNCAYYWPWLPVTDPE